MSKRARDVEDFGERDAIDEVDEGQDLQQIDLEGGIVEVDQEDDREGGSEEFASSTTRGEKETEQYYIGDNALAAETESYDNDATGGYGYGYAEDEDVGIDIDAAMNGDANISYTGSTIYSSAKSQETAKNAWAFLGSEERKHIDSQDSTQSENQMPVSSFPSEEKLRKIATKLAASNLTRPPSSFIVFSTRRRAELGPELSFKEKAQLISSEFKALTGEQKEELDAKCRADREVYENKLEVLIQKEMENLRNDPDLFTSLNAGASAMKNANFSDLDFSSTNIALPLAKVKRAIKCNPDVKNCGKEATALIAKAAEIFTAYIGFKSASISALRGAKTIQERDFIHMLHTNDHCDFLREDFPRRAGEDGGKGKPKTKVVESEDADDTSQNKSGAIDKKAERLAALSVGSSKVTSFFTSSADSSADRAVSNTE